MVLVRLQQASLVLVALLPLASATHAPAMQPAPFVPDDELSDSQIQLMLLAADLSLRLQEPHSPEEEQKVLDLLLATEKMLHYVAPEDLPPNEVLQRLREIAWTNGGINPCQDETPIDKCYEWVPDNIGQCYYLYSSSVKCPYIGSKEGIDNLLQEMPWPHTKHHQDGITFTWPYETIWDPNPQERASFIAFPETPYSAVIYDFEKQVYDLLGVSLDDLRRPPAVIEKPYQPNEPLTFAQDGTATMAAGSSCEAAHQGAQEACTIFILHGIATPWHQWATPWEGPASKDMTKFSELRSALLEEGYENVWRVDYYGGACDHDISAANNYGFHDRLYASGHNMPDKPSYGCDGQNRVEHSMNTDIRHLSYHLAQAIHIEAAQFLDYIDIAAYSMGGAVTRAMLAHVASQTQAPGFPQELYVEDVVTMGSPLDGHYWENAPRYGNCPGAWLQLEQICSRSNFANEMRSIGQDPQGSGAGTEWTLIGSECDQVVSARQATNMDAYIRWEYHWETGDNPCYDHDEYFVDLDMSDGGAFTYYSEGPMDEAERYIWNDAPPAGTLILRSLTRYLW